MTFHRPVLDVNVAFNMITPLKTLAFLRVVRYSSTQPGGKALEYFPAPEVDAEILRIIRSVRWNHINPDRVRAIRSRGTRSRRILARCHGLPKALQTGLSLPAHYVIELISEKFDRLSGEEQVKTLIHELLHIPRVFGGGFRNHDYVRERRVNQLYDQYMRSTESPPDFEDSDGSSI